VGHCFEKPWKIIERNLSHFSAKGLASNTNGTPLGSAKLADVVLDTGTGARQVCYIGPRANLVSTAIVAFAAGVTVSFFTLPLWVTFAINVAKEGSRTDWLGFTGSVIGAVVALIAAIIAWFAVQQQIEAQRFATEQARIGEGQKTEKQQEEAKAAAKIVLIQTVHAAAAAFNVADQVLEAVDRGAVRAQITNLHHRFGTVMQSLKATMDHFAIAQAWQGLGIEDKTNYLIVTATVHTVMTMHENPAPNIDDIASIRNQHDAFSKLAIYLRAFDAELADVYERDAKV
jgi:hypothetical protein